MHIRRNPLKVTLGVALALTVALAMVLAPVRAWAIDGSSTTAALYIGATVGGKVKVTRTQANGGGLTEDVTIGDGGSTVSKAYAELSWYTSSVSTTWKETVTLTAAPVDGYTFKGWSTGTTSTGSYPINNNYNSDTVSVNTSSSSTFIAVFESTVPTDIVSVSMDFVAPIAGQNASSLGVSNCVSMASDAHSSAIGITWYSEQSTSSSQPFTGTFVAETTYYAVITLKPDSGYRFLQGGESGSGSAPTTFTVSSDATALNEGWLYVTNTTGDQWGTHTSPLRRRPPLTL